MRRRTGALGDRQLRARAVAPPSMDKLPLVHVTAVFNFGDILRPGKLQTKRCKVFDLELLYFFVLKPAYRDGDSAEKLEQLTRFPTVLVLRAGAVDPPHHVYPFDTGAAAGGYFSVKADPIVPLEDYELKPTHAAAAGHIEWAFGTREAYYDALLRQDVLDDVPHHEGVTRGFVDVARMGRDLSNLHDRRASAVEVAYGHDVDLKGAVELAIVPKQYLEDPRGDNGAAMADLKEMEIPWRTYEWLPNCSPDDFQKDIETVVREWLVEKEWL